MSEGGQTGRRLTGRALLAMFVLLAAREGATAEVRIGAGDRAWNEWAAPFRHDIELDGVALHYLDAGEGPAVMLIHGFADSSYCWHKNARPLVEAGYRVVAIDLPGLGRSPLPPESFRYKIENLAGVVLALADRLRLERFSLLGSSMGGGVSLFLGQAHPERVERVLAMDPVCFRPAGDPLVANPLVARLGELFASRFFFRAGLRDVYFDDALVTDALVDEYARPAVNRKYFRVLSRLVRDYFTDRFAQMAKNHGSLRPPLLIVWGEEDRWLPPEFGARLHAMVPASRLVTIPACGHLPHQECADRTNPVLLDFLQPLKSR